MIAVHLGVVNEDDINNMSYLFFEDVLESLGHKLSYDAVVNYAGNSFAKDSWDMIQDANPFNAIKGEHGKKSKALHGIAELFKNAKVVKTTEGSYGDLHRKAGKGNEKGKG